MLIRSIWNDGQSLTTPELQRNNDIAAYADDRALEIIATPGSILKKVVPTVEGSASINPRLLLVPSATTGKVTCQPAWFQAATAAQVVTMGANLGAALDTPAGIASNSSGGIRYDLVYATINRQVAATIGSPPSGSAYCGIGQANTGTSSTQSRKIKSVVDGSISTQSVNLYDVPTVQLAVVQGFLTGATAPTIAQINAALPADTASSFNFAIGYVTVANGYTAGVAVAQNSGGGSTFITQAWSGGFIHRSRIRGHRPASIYYGAANEKAPGVLTAGVQGGERWGAGAGQFFAHFRMLNSSSPSLIDIRATGVLVDNAIDWRNRIIYGFYSYIGSGNQAQLESVGVPMIAQIPQAKTAAGNPVYNTGVIPPTWTGPGINNSGLIYLQYTDIIPNYWTQLLGVDTNGVLRAIRGAGGVADGTNGDLLVVVLYATDQVLLNI